MTPEVVVAETELRRDPLSGRLVVVAPGRSKRPGAFRRSPVEVTPEELESCPFCAGREERTPPETLRLPAGAEQWQVRVVPNLYPAFEGQEVVIHTPRHCQFVAELTDDEIAVVADAWQARAAAREGYLHAFVNERSEAGRACRTRTRSSSGSSSRRPRSSASSDPATAASATRPAETSS